MINLEGGHNLDQLSLTNCCLSVASFMPDIGLWYLFTVHAVSFVALTKLKMS